MERRELYCDRCKENTQHTFRYHITKTKHYSAISIGAGERTVTLICHGCLLETPVAKNDAEQLIAGYDKDIAVWEANECMEKGDNKNAEKKLKKLLTKDPKHPQGVYSMAKCLISQTKYSEAEFYVKNLELDFSENDDVKALRKLMP